MSYNPCKNCEWSAGIENRCVLPDEDGPCAYDVAKALAVEKKAIAFDLAWRKEHDGETLCCVCEVPGRWLASHDGKAYCATCLANQLAAEVAERDNQLTQPIERIEQEPAEDTLTLISSTPWSDQGGHIAFYRTPGTTSVYIQFRESEEAHNVVYRINIEEAAIKILEHHSGIIQTYAREILKARRA